MPKLIDYQYTYIKKVGFTKSQRNSFEILKYYGVNINQFIRQAVKEKIQRDWKEIKEQNKEQCPF